MISSSEPADGRRSWLDAGDFQKTLERFDSMSTNGSVGDIAIIGMAGRFPGAKNVAEFWQNLKNGVESISFFSAEQLGSLGVDSALLNNPNYVRAGGVLEGIDMFDASFFGVSAREAEIMDPQQRLFLECAWEALENAGYNSERFNGTIGVYAGAGTNYYLLNNLYGNRHFLETHEPFETLILNDKDFLATRVAYKLNLTGPAVTIQTACSTSLVAVHAACQNLLDYQCDMALAGGVRIDPHLANGYLYREGMILAPDGHCRAFDAKAGGTVRGNAVGVVALKRFADALADGDFIYALIKGSAVNNDGSTKVGYTAPSVVGQAAVVAMAQAMSGIDPETISYIEAHGTGTLLGDPIEIAGLTQAFRAKTQKKGFCAIGSLKTNVGHTDAAAGAAGLIKTIQALRHKLIPPSLNFTKANPEIDFEHSPFYVNSTLCEWGTKGVPRRAGVSSFGIGGTNAHAVIEEAPPVDAPGPSRPWQLLVLSAKTKSALEAASRNLSEHLEQHPDLELADVAFTLQVGRKAFNHRRALVCQNLNEAAKALRSVDSKSVVTSDQEIKDRTIVFMFPGQGSQYLNMGRELYDTESTFREQLDNCADLLAPKLGMDLRVTLFPTKDYAEEASRRLNRTLVAQPALFAVEYALARLLMSWGVRPRAMIGHSVGEYVAACLAGVFSVEDGLTLIAARGRLMDRLPEGTMLAVALSIDEVKPLLNDVIALAAHNGPQLCVLSGQEEELQQVEGRLREMGIGCRRLHTSHAFHSPMMEPVLQPFTEEVRKIKLRPSTIPFLSNVSGSWITSAAATDPNYWAKQLRRTVRFSEGLKELLQQPDGIFIEVGPGQALSSAAKLHGIKTGGHIVLPSMKRSQDSQSDLPPLLGLLGRLWLTGVKVDWSAFYSNENRRRSALPTYPFERQRYWVDPQGQLRTDKMRSLPPSKKSDMAGWFYLPSWKRTAAKTFDASALKSSESSWLVFLDECGVGAQLAMRLEQSGQDVISVRAGGQFCKITRNVYAIDPQKGDDYHTLLRELHQSNKQLRKVVHFWSVTENTRTLASLERLEQRQDLGLFSLLFLAQAFGQQQITSPVDILVVSNHIHEITGDETLGPEKSTVLGACKIIPLEYSNMSCTSVDIVTADSEPLLAPKLIDALLAETMANATDNVVAYRGTHRWVQCFEPVRLDKAGDLTARLRDGGVYLITGGLGGIGLAIAEDLAITAGAKLILISRSSFPEREQWESWIRTHDERDPISIKIRRLHSFEAAGAEVLVLRADVASLDQMQNALLHATREFGRIHGVIHAAGIADYAGIIDRRSREMTESVLAPKVIGTLVLDELLRTTKLDFFVMCSSLSSILYRGKFGQVGYCAANEFLDAFAGYKLLRDKTFTVSINWCDWQEVGMAVDSRKRWAEMHGIIEDSDTYREALSLREGLAPSEGAEVFRRILGAGYSRIAVSTSDLFPSIEHDTESLTPAFIRDFEKAIPLERNHRPPELGTVYVAPRNKTEQTLAQVWQELLGYNQIGIHDNFFHLGGHSLMATQLLSRIVEAFGINVPLRTMFDWPTVAEMAALITQMRQAIDADRAQMLSEVESLSDDEAQLRMGGINSTITKK
jgi:acyl transferase domain-containing protein/acyl carrier protein